MTTTGAVDPAAHRSRHSQLFARDGFDGTTVEALVAAADIAPRTFFYYFPAKEDVVLADYASRLQRIVDQLGQRADDEPPRKH